MLKFYFQKLAVVQILTINLWGQFYWDTLYVHVYYFVFVYFNNDFSTAASLLETVLELEAECTVVT